MNARKMVVWFSTVPATELTQYARLVDKRIGGA